MFVLSSRQSTSTTRAPSIDAACAVAMKVLVGTMTSSPGPTVIFQDEIEAFPLPFGAFSRNISLFSHADWADQVPRDVAQTLRRLAQTQIIDPCLTRMPFLVGKLRVIEA